MYGILTIYTYICPPKLPKCKVNTPVPCIQWHKASPICFHLFPCVFPRNTRGCWTVPGRLWHNMGHKASTAARCRWSWARQASKLHDGQATKPLPMLWRTSENKWKLKRGQFFFLRSWSILKFVACMDFPVCMNYMNLYMDFSLWIEIPVGDPAARFLRFSVQHLGIIIPGSYQP